MTLTAQSNTPPNAPGSRSPTVLQVLPALDSGGVERGTIEIAGGLSEAGWHAIVASRGGAMENELARAGAEHVRLPLDRKNPAVIYRNVAELVDLIETRGVDIVHARSRAPGWSACLAARRAKCPFVTTFHGAYGEGPLKHWYNSVMTKGDVVIAISEFIARHIRSHFNVDEDRLVIIHRGVDTVNFDPSGVSAERIVQQADTWRLDDGATVILVPARLTRLKGQAVLLRALARMDRQDFVVVLLGGDRGSSSYRREIDALIKSQNLGSRVRMVPPCRDMPAAYMLADIVVSTSIQPEGFGRTIVEAQAMGRPIIASNHGGAPETILPGKTGWLTAPGDEASLAQALDAAMALNRSGREAMAAKARENVIRHFSIERMRQQTLDVYRRLLVAR